jgi:hypothetical protein
MLMLIFNVLCFLFDSTDMAAIYYRLFELKRDWIIIITDAGQSPHFQVYYQSSCLFLAMNGPILYVQCFSECIGWYLRLFRQVQFGAKRPEPNNSWGANWASTVSVGLYGRFMIETWFKNNNFLQPVYIWRIMLQALLLYVDDLWYSEGN